MKVIGLIGGIASGKSAVATELAELGAKVLDADLAAHQAINLPEVKQALTNRWGTDILLPTGDVDRQKIAGLVFSEDSCRSENLRFLEKTLHPVIRRQFESELTQLTETGHGAAVIDAPLLLEAGWGNLCDAIVFVDSPRESRVQRALLRNWTEEQFTRREAAQMPIDEKRRQATYIIANHQSAQDLKNAVREFWESSFSDG